MSRRGQGIGRGVPQVALAVAVEIHRMLVIGGGHELGLAHGAGPGTDHAIAGYIAVLQDLQGGQQLSTPEALAATVIGQGGEGADYAVATDIVTEVALQAPDGHQDLRFDAILLLDTLQHGVVLGQQYSAAADAAGGDGTVEIFPHRASELGLTAVCLEHRRVRGDASEYAIEQRRVDAGGNRFATHGLTPVGETGQGCFGCSLDRCSGSGGRQIFRRGLGAGRQQQERKQSQDATRKLVWHVYLRTFKQALTLACSGNRQGHQ